MFGAVALAVVAAVWFQQPPYWTVAQKSNARLLARRLEPRLGAGGVVLAAQPESVPVLRYYLGPRRRYLTPLGVVRDPGVMDWRDALSRLRASRVASTVARVDRLPPGTRVAFVRQPAAHGGAPWPRLVRRRTAMLARRLVHDRHLRRVVRVRRGFGGSRSTLLATVYAVRSP